MIPLEELAGLTGTAPADLPVALLPLRLETRFVPVGGGNVEFRLRIYPDDIHIDAFEPELTEDEFREGQRYWRGRWEAGDDEDHIELLWRRLAERFDPPRAAWIARALRPRNIDALGTGEPDLPDASRRGDSWTAPARVRLMPRRWAVFGYLEGERVLLQVTAPIPPDLQAGPSPNAPAPQEESDETLALDPGMKWLVDFDEAERVGMALRVTLDPHAADHGFDRLVVVGLGDEAAGALAALLEAQHHTDGLSFVPQGTPTNNTDRSAAGDTVDDATLGRAETGAPLCAADDGSDGALCARAFGIDVGVFAHAVHADSRDRAGAGHMNRALWSAGWGTYLREIVRLPGTPDLSGLRDTVVRHLRAGGPLPTLRAGAQPYGVLPVIAGSASGDPVAATLDWLRQKWQPLVARTPRVAPSLQPAEAREALLRALAMEATSIGLRARPILHESMFGLTGTPGFGLELPVGTDERRRNFAAIATELGLASAPRQAHLVPTAHAFPLSARIVPDSGEAGACLTWLATASYDDIRDERFGDGEPPFANTLLYLLLRYAVLAEYAYAAGAIRVEAGDLAEAEVSEPDFYRRDGPEAPTPPTRLRLADGEVAALGSGPLSQHLHALDGTDHPALAPVAALRESLKALAELPAATLDRLLRESIDVCSYRLDAWYTAAATARLEALRDGRPEGVLTGGYGLLEDVRMSRHREPAEAPAGEAMPVWVDTANAGFVLAPSLGHAATAAVLRSGYLAQPDAGNPLAVDLSSRRVRLAEWLLAGVRQGQPLAALLGYRVERDLQESGLARYIAPLRRLSPFGEIEKTRAEIVRLQAELAGLRPHNGIGADPRVALQAALDAAEARLEDLIERHRRKYLFPAGADIEAMEAVEVESAIDGLALREMYKANAMAFGQRGLPAQGTEDFAAMNRVLGRLDDAVDAVADTVTAESVHQMILGNTMKLGATLSAVSEGEVPPPELDVTRTPRTGVALEHRLCLLFAGPAPSGSGWPGSGTRPRAAADRYLDGWAAGILGNPAATRISVAFVGADGSALGHREGTLADLELSASDVVYGMRGQESVEAATLGQWVTHHFAPDAPEGTAEIRLVTDRGEAWAPTDLSLAELGEIARAILALVTGAQPVSPEDFAGWDGVPVRKVNAANLEARAEVAATALRAARDGLLEAEHPHDTLLALSFFGIDTAVPVAGADLALQRAAVEAEVEDRVAQLDDLAAKGPASSSPADRRDHAEKVLKTVFGPDFVALTRLEPDGADDLGASFRRSDMLMAGDAFAPQAWLHRMARVREGAERLETVLLYAESLTNHRSNRLDRPLSVAQLPHDETDRWLGLPYPKGTEPPGGRVSFVAHLPVGFDPTKPVLGLMIDRWVEVLPAPRQTAAIALNHDAPGARAPQAILLAVPPQGMEAWTVEALEAVVTEAFELARLRTVDPTTLQEIRGFNDYLPALYLALNLDTDTDGRPVTISADLMRAAVAAD